MVLPPNPNHVLLLLKGAWGRQNINGELEEALINCEVIEDYPDDPRGASFLDSGRVKADRFMRFAPSGTIPMSFF